MSFTSYEVDNDKAFRDALKEASKNIGDFRIPFGLISADFYRSEQSIFKLKSPGKYPDLSERYGKYKQKKVGFKYPILVRSGRLAASMLGPRNPGSINVITALSLFIGTSIPYGIYHQSDLPRKSKLPQRKFLFIGPEAPSFASSEQVGRLQRWLGIVNDHVNNVTKRDGPFK